MADVAFPSPLPKVHLTWTASTTPGALTSVLRSSTSGGPYIPVTSGPIAGTAYTDDPGPGTFFYVITATANNLTSAYSGEAKAVVPNPTAAPTGLSASVA